MVAGYRRRYIDPFDSRRSKASPDAVIGEPLQRYMVSTDSVPRSAARHRKKSVVGGTGSRSSSSSSVASVTKAKSTSKASREDVAAIGGSVGSVHAVLAKRNAKRLSYGTPTSSSRAPRDRSVSRTDAESPPGASSAEEDVAAVDRPPKGPATPPTDASKTNTSLETDVLDVTEHPLSEQSLTGSPATEEEIDRELIHDLDLAPKSPPNIRHRRTRSSENAMATPVGLGEDDGELGGVGSTPASPFGERDKNDASCSPVTQFRRSLLALKGLGLQGADGVVGTNTGVGMGAHTPISPVVRDIIESTEEQEAAQMRILLEERSRAREMVQRLERDKQMQAEQLRMMEERMEQSEMTEEELRETEAALRRARREVETLAASKEALEKELDSQLSREEEWSRRLRDAELAGMSSTEKAIKERDEYAAKVEALERELEATRAREVNQLIAEAKVAPDRTRSKAAHSPSKTTGARVVDADLGVAFAAPERAPFGADAEPEAEELETAARPPSRRSRAQTLISRGSLVAFVVAIVAVAVAVISPFATSISSVAVGIDASWWRTRAGAVLTTNALENAPEVSAWIRRGSGSGGGTRRPGGDHAEVAAKWRERARKGGRGRGVRRRRREGRRSGRGASRQGSGHRRGQGQAGTKEEGDGGAQTKTRGG